jgi:uncharacterized protein YjbJ (UPF0337 family)
VPNTVDVRDAGPVGIPVVDDRRNDMGATDKVKNEAEDLKGKAKEAAGKATGDDSLKNKGKVDQAKGSLKQAGENVKDAFK